MNFSTGILLLANFLLCTAYRRDGNRSPHASTSEDLSYKNLKLVYSWKSLDFVFPSAWARNQAIQNKDFIPGNPFPIDVDASAVEPTGPRVFVTIPRFQEGVPATLGYVTNFTSSDGSPLIAPYPNWEMNQLGSCSHITSVYRIKIDECNRMWILDTGVLLGKKKCSPQLLIFDLTTDRLISQYQFPERILKAESLLITPVVDIRGSCANTFVYIADVTGFQLIVYDFMNQNSWNIQNNLFYPYPDFGRFTIAGESFDLMDGIFGMALGPFTSSGDRMLYFHSLASVVENFVPTSIIRNSSLFLNHADNLGSTFQTFGQRRSSQSGPEAMTGDGILFYGLMSDTAIGCWNSRNYPEFGGSNLDFAVVNNKTLQFISGLKIIRLANRKDQVWTITGRFQKLMTGTLSSQEVNFRIQAAYVEDLISGTKCTPLVQNNNHHHHHYHSDNYHY